MCDGTQIQDWSIGELPPAARALRESSGAYSVTGFLPENDGQPVYRIQHFSEEHPRVAQESELSAV